MRLHHFSRALALDPKSVEAHVDLAVTLRAPADPKKAFASCAARGARAKTVFAHNHLGVMLLELQRLDEAIASFGGRLRSTRTWPWRSSTSAMRTRHSGT